MTNTPHRLTAPMLDTSLAKNDISMPIDTKSLPTDIPLSQHVERVIRQYLIQLDGDEPHNLYDTLLTEVEKPLLSVIIEHTKGNQTKMAKILGVSRGTLRKKLAQYDLM